MPKIKVHSSLRDKAGNRGCASRYDCESAGEGSRGQRDAAQVAGEKKLEEALKSAAKEIAEIRNTAKKKEEETVNVIISSLV